MAPSPTDPLDTLTRLAAQMSTRHSLEELLQLVAEAAAAVARSCVCDGSSSRRLTRRTPSTAAAASATSCSSSSSDRCCGESGTLAVTRPDISTQVRFRKEEELRKGEAALRESGQLAAGANVRILTSCPSCLQGLKRYEDDMTNGLLEADYIVVEMARKMLGESWLEDYVSRANAGGIERVLV